MPTRRTNAKIPVRVVERLSGYRRSLRLWLREGHPRIYSHQLAAMEGATPAQVRRDLMTIGFTGSPARGYEVAGLVARIGGVLDPPAREGVALVGVGYLGRAVLNYLRGSHPELAVLATFDIHPDKVGRIIDGCHCYATSEMNLVIAQKGVRVAVISVPAEAAQGAADRLVGAGVRGILNFSPARLRVPPEVYVENVDIATSLEKVAFFARPEVTRLEKPA